MYIKSLILSDFRMLKQINFKFDNKINVIYGKNGQGKTSIIEAIYFLATGKSFRTRKINEQIKHNKKRAVVFAKIDDDNYSVELLKDKKAFYINKNRNSYSDYVGIIPAVSFSPEDIELITDAPDVRRRFFNYEISQTNKIYLRKIIEFQKVLKVRNKLLKEAETKSAIFSIYNKKYIELCIDIYEIRKQYIENLSYLINQQYTQLFGTDKEISIKYEAYFNFNDNAREEKIKEFTKYLENKLEKETLLGYSLYGIQKDEFVFYINKQKVKAYASQGEKKSIIFALKLAQVEDIIQKNNKKPIFLLDDITAYFDEVRKKKVIDYFIKKEIQCFFTSTEKLDIEAKNFEISNGEVI